MWAERLLAIASWLCGDAARQTVFEPLVADWQRQCLATRGPIRRALVMATGGAAYATSLALRIDTRDTVQRHAIGIGWRRARTNRAIGIRIVVGSWLGGWLAASVLGALAGYQGMYRQPADPGPTMWLPPLTLLIVGHVAWVMLLRNAPTLDSAAPGPRH